MNRTEEYYDNFFEMFQTPGWDQFESQAKERLELLKELVFQIQDTKDLHYQRGVHDILSEIVNFRAFIETGRQAIEEDE